MANKFIPVQGTEEQIKNLDEIVDGRVYVATDTGTIYADLNGRRMSIGGSGSGGGNGNIRFAKADSITKHEDGYYHIQFTELEDQTIVTVPVDTVVINSDGSFYRVKKFENNILYCDQIAVSGGGGGSAEKIYVELSKEVNTTNFINGEAAYANVTPHSGVSSSGATLDDNLDVTWSLCTRSGTTYTTYYHDTVTVADGETYRINFGAQAKESETSYLFVEATGINSGVSDSKNFSFNMVDLSIEAASIFSNDSPYSYDNVFAAVNVVGDLEKIIDYYFDGELVHSDTVSATFTNPQQCKFNTYLDSISHGYHTVEVRLYQSVQGERGIEATPVKMEIAVKTNSADPIIWFGDYSSSYYSYDDIKIPYHIYYPNKTAFTADLLKDNAKIDEGSWENLSNGLVSDIFEITDADAPEGSSTTPVRNNYGISIPNTDVARDFEFLVAKDPDRDMTLQKSLFLDFNFDAKGRSNNQSLTQRTSLYYGENNSTFSDFTWGSTNGWVRDDDGNTCLRISNGASLSIPIGAMTFADASDAKGNSHTFEIQFKVRNVQNYDSLISNITRYKNDTKYYNEFYGYLSYTEDTSNVYNINNDYFVQDESGNYVDAEINNEEQYIAKKATTTVYIGHAGYKTSYTNYDAFLKYYLDLHAGEEDVPTYDELTEKYDYTEKRYNLSAIICGYYSGKDKAPIGFGLGPQDVFFTNGVNTVNANYVEDEVVNVSIVYDHSSNKLMSIYVNGILTGVIYSTLADSFTINNNALVFNSNYCDIDLYKFRIYSTPLSLNDIGTNYAVDKKDVLLYDQNALAYENATIGEYQFSYDSMIAYNTKHPAAPLMPYIIYDTSDCADDRLSWSKSTKLNIGVEFVNTALDSAYQLGKLDDLAAKMTDAQKAAATAAGMTNVEYYYLHHCPSWKGSNISMAVQGTSSEFYPRRNYKLKTKDDNGVNMNMHKGPFADNITNTKWFYMDNYSVGTTKFTMKIDYMESSGSYNRGLGNLLKNAYSKHPLDYYSAAGALSKASTSYQAATEYVAGTTYYYLNSNEEYKEVKNVTFPEDFDLSEEKVQALIESMGKTSKDNKLYIANTTYTPSTDWDFDELRTNVQGFPVLAFHKKSDGTYTYIGRYNMLIDKGSDEEYGFKNDDIYLTYLKNKNVKKKAECWEFENNARGLCSFRDTLNRKVLSFNNNAYTESLLDPECVEDFEYRFHTYADDLDIMIGTDATKLDQLTPAQQKTIKDDTGYDVSSAEKAQNAIYDIYGNWELACRWVWSTALDATFVKTEEEIAALDESAKSEYLLREYNKVPSTATYDASTPYYKYDRHIYVSTSSSEETWAEDVAAGLYTLDTFTKQFVTDGTIYEYDSYEYRYDKFKYELEDHFNLDYLATYFVVTEVLELYDSRGKNCMMASWGPMKDGGDYVWFPIFYDMDTQLGINNTGIPSFDYNIDATEQGTFSTNDSVLWNNFYKVFQAQITEKYCQLLGQTSGIGTFEPLSYGPFASIDRIEAWYESDPTECNSLSMSGVRPLSAINLDEYYKYISITNGKGPGYLGQSGNYIWDNTSTSTGTGTPIGSYFYALQGDRSLSRRQFLTNRLNYIDSWLGVKAYAKSGAGDESFWGRFSANDTTGEKLSDIWVDTLYPTSQLGYWTTEAKTKKLHDFDGEYWLTLTPNRKSYARIIADDSVYSAKYTDTPVKVEMTSRENTIRTSAKLSESLFYALGVNILQSLGDLSKLYITELHTVDAPKLTELILGWDGLDSDGNEYKNHDTNRHTFSSMPLLKELNLSNIQYKSDVDKTLDFSSCEKLQNFRAYGSNFTQITFAEGVALHTLHLPSTITELRLNKAKRLENLITSYTHPTLNTTTNKLEAQEGLYIQNFTDYLDDPENSSAVCNITVLSLIDIENFGYNAYKLLKGYHDIRKYKKLTSKINLTNVNWCPYKQVDEGSIYNSSKTYVKNTYHDQFEAYTYNEDTWEDDIANGIVYVLNDETELHTIKNIELLEDLYTSSYFTDLQGNNVPTLSGIMYIDNDEALVTTSSGSITSASNGKTYTWAAGDPVDECFVRNVLNTLYPDMTFFFKTLAKDYTARFILLDEDDNNLYTTIGIQTIDAGTGDNFTNPIDMYGDISEMKDNYDFYGWATSPTAGESEVIVNADKSINTWDDLTITSEDNIFYAIFSIHKYEYHFFDGNDEELSTSPVQVPYNTTIEGISEMPNVPDSELGVYEGWKLAGWSLTEDRSNIIDVSSYKSIKDRDFYAVFTKIESPDDIRNYPTDESYFEIDSTTHTLTIKSDAILKGKIVIPKEVNDIPVYGLGINFLANNTTVTHVLFEAGSTVTTLGNYAFANSNIVYFEPLTTLTMLNVNAFTNCYQLTTYDWSMTAINTIADNTFSNAFADGTHTITMPSTVKYVNQYAFAYYGLSKDIESITFGGTGNPSQLTAVNANAFVQNGTAYPSHDLEVWVYCSDTETMNTVFANVNIDSNRLHIINA